MTLILGSAQAVADDKRLITKDKLLSLMNDDTVVIIDVRRQKHWDGSEHKIKGAVRLNFEKFFEALAQYPKENTLIVYCA